MLDNDEPGKILVIDDEDSLRLTFEMFLKRAGYEPVIGVSSYAEALTKIEHQDFDLIISDIVLEGASGIDLLRRVKEMGKKCPMVMITGYPNIETAAEAVRLGAFDYIPKPVKKDALLKVVALALEQQTLQNERERFEAEKEKNRYYQETVLRSVREIIITVDPSLRIVNMNDMAREWTKSYMSDFVIGSQLADIPGAVGKAFFQDADQVKKTREEIKEHRIQWRESDNKHGVLSITAAPFIDKNNKFLGVVLISRDVTHLDKIDLLAGRSSFHGFLGSSPSMQKVYALIENVGQVDTTVLVTGESGTGKELVADALHAVSQRSKRSLVKVDCTSIPEELLESELFGHRKGAFTGADRDRLGRILQADGGTLFLDEIGDISPRMQLRLLRFLQERTFYPVGQDQPIQVDVRVITATNANLKQKVQDDSFREDLYFRLRVVDIILPPLRERKDDIPLLTQHFLNRFEEKMKKGINGFSDQAIDLLLSHNWPGNVRELEHIVERACVLCGGGTITTEHLPQEILQDSVSPDAGQAATDLRPSVGTRAEGTPQGFEDLSEEEKIIQALQRAGGNKAKAARLLDIDRSTLYRKIQHYNIDLSFVESG